jgi:hypothetical protein
VGRWLGEMIGYMCTLLAMLLMFWPTRTAIIATCIVVLLNIWVGTALSVWLSAGACLILHSIFLFTEKMRHRWWGEHGSRSENGWWSENNHWHH